MERKNLHIFLAPGQQVRLDKDKANSSVVTVVSQTPKRIYTTVTNGKNDWAVMTYRLEPLKITNNNN